MRVMFRLTLVALAVLTAACGEDHKRSRASPADNPAAPALVANESQIVVRGGGDARVIMNAFATVDGITFKPDENGTITIPGRIGREAAITVPTGHLAPRTVRLVPGFIDVMAWYLPPGVGAEDVRCLVYKAWNGEQNLPLLRLPPGAVVYLVPEGEIATEAFAKAFEDGIGVARSLGDAADVSFQLAGPSGPPPGAIVFRAYVNADDKNVAGARAVTYRNVSGNYVSGGEIVFSSASYVKPAVIGHELGHAAGLMHSCDPADLMAGSEGKSGFSPKELAIVREARNRPGGNLWIDSEPGLSASTMSVPMPKRSFIVD